MRLETGLLGAHRTAPPCNQTFPSVLRCKRVNPLTPSPPVSLVSWAQRSSFRVDYRRSARKFTPLRASCRSSQFFRGRHLNGSPRFSQDKEVSTSLCERAEKVVSKLVTSVSVISSYGLLCIEVSPAMHERPSPSSSSSASSPAYALVVATSLPQLRRQSSICRPIFRKSSTIPKQDSSKKSKAVRRADGEK